MGNAHVESVIHKILLWKPRLLVREESGPVRIPSGIFTLARTATYSTEAEWKAVPQLLAELPLMPQSLAADAGYYCLVKAYNNAGNSDHSNTVNGTAVATPSFALFAKKRRN